MAGLVGVGQGVGGGEKRPGAGRPRGARNRRSRQCSPSSRKRASSRRSNFCWRRIRTRRSRCASGSAPQWRGSVLPRSLSPQRVLPPIVTMDDEALLALIAAIEQRLGKASAADRGRPSMIDEALVESVGELPHRRQEDLLLRLANDAQERLRSGVHSADLVLSWIQHESAAEKFPARPGVPRGRPRPAGRARMGRDPGRADPLLTRSRFRRIDRGLNTSLLSSCFSWHDFNRLLSRVPCLLQCWSMEKISAALRVHTASL